MEPCAEVTHSHGHGHAGYSPSIAQRVNHGLIGIPISILESLSRAWSTLYCSLSGIHES